MTMLSFRVDDAEAAEAQRWSEQLGIDRSEILRQALRLYLVRLAGENDATSWVDHPLDGDEQSLMEVAAWGPAEDWSDWGNDAAR
jgi:hypothetical protein